MLRLALRYKQETDALMKSVLGPRDVKGEAALEAAVQSTQAIRPQEEAILRYIVKLKQIKESLYDTVAWSVLNDVAGSLGVRQVQVDVGLYSLAYKRPARPSIAITPSRAVTERQAISCDR